MENVWHLLEDDIPDPRRLACEVDVVPAMVYTRLDDRCAKAPIWPNGVDDHSRMLNDSVYIIDVCDIQYE